MGNRRTSIKPRGVLTPPLGQDSFEGYTERAPVDKSKKDRDPKVRRQEHPGKKVGVPFFTTRRRPQARNQEKSWHHDISRDFDVAKRGKIPGSKVGVNTE